MTPTAIDPVLQAVLESAVGATAASEGWVLRLRDDRLEVVAAAGAQPGPLLGITIPAGEGTAGFVSASGQPLAFSGRGVDPRMRQGMAEVLGQDFESVLCVPCIAEDRVLGALEMVDRRDGGSFTFDDVELATLLAGIAGVALRGTAGPPEVPSPAQLGQALGALSDVDPARYAAIAPMIESLMASG
jgi:GAF domain-containing protein